MPGAGRDETNRDADDVAPALVSFPSSCVVRSYLNTQVMLHVMQKDKAGEELGGGGRTPAKSSPRRSLEQTVKGQQEEVGRAGLPSPRWQWPWRESGTR